MKCYLMLYLQLLVHVQSEERPGVGSHGAFRGQVNNPFSSREEYVSEPEVPDCLNQQIKAQNPQNGKEQMRIVSVVASWQGNALPMTGQPPFDEGCMLTVLLNYVRCLSCK